MRTITKQNKVINYLTKRGRTLTASEARARFGVRNLRIVTGKQIGRAHV